MQDLLSLIEYETIRYLRVTRKLNLRKNVEQYLWVHECTR